MSDCSPISAPLFPELVGRSPRVPLPTCELAIRHAARDNTQLHLSRLVPDIRAYVDRLLRDLPWHAFADVQREHLGPGAIFSAAGMAGEGDDAAHYVIGRRGERVLVSYVPDPEGDVRPFLSAFAHVYE